MGCWFDLGAGCKDRQRHGEGGSFAFLAFERDVSAVESDASLDDGKAKSGSRNTAGILATMKGSEQPLLIRRWNPQAFIPHRENRITMMGEDAKLDRPSRRRILDRIGK